MGGEGSGRTPSVETLIKRSQPVLTPVGNDLFIPNYSGVQKAALKDAPAIQSGTTDHSALSNLAYATSGHTGFQPAGSYLTAETDPVFMALSGAFLTSYTETDPVFMALSGAFVKTEVDPFYAATSGAFVRTETDPVFMSLSGAFITEETALTGSGATVIYGSFPNFIIGSSASGSESDPVFMSLSGAFAPSAKGVTNGDSHDHSGGDGAQINHTTLSNIGTNTHAQIDSHISDASDPHGATLTQTTLVGTTIKGVTSISGANVWATTNMLAPNHSGATIFGTTSVSGADVYATTSMIAPTIKGSTAVSGANVYATTSVIGANVLGSTLVSGANVYSTGVLSGATVYAANITVPTSISGALFQTTTDHTTSGAERMRNIVIGTEATPGAASGWYQGTIYLKYTA